MQRENISGDSYHCEHIGSREAPPPLRVDVPTFDRTSGPNLSAETVDEFLQWAAAVPVVDVVVIRERIASVQYDQRLLERLSKELWALPVRDVSRHRLLLSTLGELKNTHAVETLVKFVWYDGKIAASDEREQYRKPCSFEPDGGDMLRARATEMISHIGSREATDAVLDIAAKHTRTFVRAAAIDAYMFNAGDSPEAAEQLRNYVQPDDIWRIGLPRLTRDMDPVKFEKAVLAFYEQNPGERPLAPKCCMPPGPSSRSWYTRCEKEVK